MRVLIVEDDVLLAELIREGLREYSIAADIVHDGHEAVFKLDVNDYDVILLDRDIPGIHGDEVCARMAEASLRTRILMVTASGSVTDRVHGLTLGADDYLAKPFDFAELVARVQALGRRSTRAVPPILRHGDLVLDPSRITVTRRGTNLALSLKEFAVLRVLMTEPGRIVSSEELLERAWDENIDPFTSTVRVTVSKLRAKLGAPPPIVTVVGVGYRMADLA
ncbi:response regulator transcription factor [Streptomyces sp. NPDC048514]|uniref:response regulator transcription factor n=1 Tax=Streptomyces sp. NPDC048514 TaxID=3365564 RepID=UPI003711BE29